MERDSVVCKSRPVPPKQVTGTSGVEGRAFCLLVIKYWYLKMKCQFCGEVCIDMDQLQIHQTTCPGVNNEDYIRQNLETEVNFQWKKDRNIGLLKNVYVILSDMDEQIKLGVVNYNADAQVFESGKVLVQIGCYTGHLIMEGDLLAIEIVSVTRKTKVIQIAISDKEMQKEKQLMTRSKTANEGMVMGNVKEVNYKLNKKLALTKKMEGCNRVRYDPVVHNNCCVITLSTAAFELFRNDVVTYLQGKDVYVIKVDSSNDKEKNITQDTIKVKRKQAGLEFDDMEPLFTINLYRTTCRVMIMLKSQKQGSKRKNASAY